MLNPYYQSTAVSIYDAHKAKTPQGTKPKYTISSNPMEKYVLSELILVALGDQNFKYVVDVFNNHGPESVSIYKIKQQLVSLPDEYFNQIPFGDMYKHQIHQILIEAVKVGNFAKVEKLVKNGADPYYADWLRGESKDAYAIALEKKGIPEWNKIINLFESKLMYVSERYSSKLITLEADSLPGDDLYQAMAKALEGHDLVDVRKLIIFAEKQGRWDPEHKFLFKSRTFEVTREVNILEAAAFTSWHGLCMIIERENISLEGYVSNILNFSFLGQLMDNVDSAHYYTNLLVSHGADVNAQFKRIYNVDGGWKILITPLQAAIELGDPRIIQVLKQAGADFTVKVKATGFFSPEFNAQLIAEGHSNDKGWIHFKDEGLSLAEYAKKTQDYKATFPREDSKINRYEVLAKVIEYGGDNGSVEVTNAAVPEHVDGHDEGHAPVLTIQQDQAAAAAEALAAQQDQAAAAEGAREGLESPEQENFILISGTTGPTRTLVIRPFAQAHTDTQEAHITSEDLATMTGIPTEFATLLI